MKFLFPILFCLLGMPLLADIQSSTGSIRFDANSDNNIDLALSSNGLGVGTTAASSNLEVLGNSVIDGELMVGTSSGNSSLEVNGSFGMNLEAVSGNTLLSTNSVILADTSSNHITLTLPHSTDLAGRSYLIKKMSASNNLYITGGNIDNLTDLILENSGDALPQVQLISGTNQWYITGLSGNSDTVLSSDNLIGWWKLDNEGDGSAMDSSGHEHHGALVGAFSFSGNAVSGKFGGSLSFDGVNDRIEVPDANTLDLTYDLTVSAWVYPLSFAGTQGGTILTKTGWAYYTEVEATTGKLRVYLNGASPAGYHKSTGALSLNTWSHIAWTYDGANVRLYINGSLDNTIAVTGDIDTTTGALHIGSLDTLTAPYDFNGYIDDVRLYSRPLSAVEIQALYQIGE